MLSFPTVPKCPAPPCVLLGTQWDAPLLEPGFKGAINWVDMAGFARWLRDSVGDGDLAAAVEEQVVGLDPYYAQVKALSALLTERMDQYRAIRGIGASGEQEPSVQSSSAGQAAE